LNMLTALKAAYLSNSLNMLTAVKAVYLSKSLNRLPALKAKSSCVGRTLSGTNLIR
jgi:hypothetical protein